MNLIKPGQSEAAFVDTPKGIFTASGLWFATTQKALEAYAGPVLERESLPRLLGRAEIWLRSSQVVTLWALPVLLLLVPPSAAALSALTLYIGWRSLGPSFVSEAAANVLRLLDVVFAQGLYYVFMLSLLAARGQMTAMWIGLAGFMLLRWGVLAKLSAPIVGMIWKSLYALPVPDQVLRAFIIRTALKHRLSLPQLDRLEEQMRRGFQRGPNAK